jgi:hypothetical protein
MKINKDTLLATLDNPAELRRLRDLHRPRKAAATPYDSVEEQLADWLGRLKLLHGIPFHYLVPDVEMLPMESIKFFYCDTTWLAYLAEGAMSLGRSLLPENRMDSVFLPDLELYSRGSMKKERAKVLGHLQHHLDKKELKLMSPEPIPLNEKITGFLLRSGVVSDWEGLEVAAFADKEMTQPCQLLRMDHLSPNVLLCMYEGMVKAIRINEHPEVLHFGVAYKENDTSIPRVFEKSFRYPQNKMDGDKIINKAGEKVEGIAPLNISAQLRNAGSRVVQMNKLAQGIKDKLADPVIGYDKAFTSAEFALEMIEGAEAVQFIIA